jgi:hypothetical protein
MAIEAADFAELCAEKSLLFGVNPHYLVAVAMLLSKINDDTDGNRIGPFRVTQADWNANGSAPEFDIALQPQHINEFEQQCTYAALQTLRAQKRFLKKKKRFPSANELYAEWPKAPPLPNNALQDALNSTKALIGSAVEAALAGLGAVVVNNIKLDAIAAAKRETARLIVEKFAAAGFGKVQQVAGLANAIAESNLNPGAHNQSGEDSVGLFQLNRNGGLGAGHSVAT